MQPFSGYGLRASRALGGLLGAMTATVLVMMLWGCRARRRGQPLPDGFPAQTSR